MAEAPSPHEAAPGARGLAVFDLDGTITYHDTLLKFLGLAVLARPPRLLGLLRGPWYALRYLLDRDRGRLKGDLIAAVLGGAARREIDALADARIQWLRKGGLRAGALATLETHRRAGDHLVLLSASPDLYVPAIARALGYDEAISTQVRWIGEQLEGRLVTENRRGAEKRIVVSALLARLAPSHSAAYGNAASDLDHLALVDAPLLVNGNAGARRAAAALRIPVTNWP